MFDLFKCLTYILICVVSIQASHLQQLYEESKTANILLCLGTKKSLHDIEGDMLSREDSISDFTKFSSDSDQQDGKGKNIIEELRNKVRMEAAKNNQNSFYQSGEKMLIVLVVRDLTQSHKQGKVLVVEALLHPHLPALMKMDHLMDHRLIAITKLHLPQIKGRTRVMKMMRMMTRRINHGNLLIKAEAAVKKAALMTAKC